MAIKLSEAAILHRNVPPDWYQRGIKENLAQRLWHSRRFPEIGKLIDSPGGKILDVGCADGTMTKFILERSKAELVVGVDILPSSIEYAKKRFSKNKRLKFKVADVEKLPFKRGEFETVFCLDSIEHFLNPQKAIKEMRRVLKKDGHLVILIHTHSLLFRMIWFFWENTKGWVWKGTHVHNFNGRELRKMVKEAGFDILIEKKFLLGMYRLTKAKKS